MSGFQWGGVAVAVVCFGALALDVTVTARRRRNRRVAWRQHVDRALELASRRAEQPRVFTYPDRDADVVQLRSEWGAR